MASFSVDDFVGNGVLKELLLKLVEGGWDDVPTIKTMNLEDMDAVNLNQQQKDALEMRSYLHDRALIQYGDTFEASGKCLTELLSLSPGDLSSQFGMKRGHIARFLNRTTECLNPSSTTKSLSRGKTTIVPFRNKSGLKSSASVGSRMSKSSSSINYDKSTEQSLSDFKLTDGYVFKGIVSAGPAADRLCGLVQAPSVVDSVAPYSMIETISVRKLTPVYKAGMERSVKTKTPLMKASELWRDKPAVLLCIRRPGCIMCRAEAHQLYAKKPIFDALGVELFAVLHEHLEGEVKDFWPRYWGGVVLFDKDMGFFKALGGGKLLKDKFLSGFLFNPQAISNYKRAKAMGAEQNFKGEGEIKGGLFIVGKGKSGIAYQFIERNFGDRSPLAEVIEICNQLQNQQQGQYESFKTIQEDE